MVVMLVGFLAFVLMLTPYVFVNRTIKTLSRISFVVVLLLILPHLFLHQEFFPIEIMEKEIFSLPDSLSLATISLFPLAIKSTILLHRHEIRLFYYIQNISLFLFVSLIKTFIQFFYLLRKFVDYVISYSY
ncbi:MAG: hypothetical protein H0X26_00760 [Alphaproteobacteria bacterium]|nr:hypothetical protein [Alphaproteobacteria bacterium]